MLFALSLVVLLFYISMKTMFAGEPLSEGAKQFLAGLAMMAAFIFIWTQ